MTTTLTPTATSPSHSQPEVWYRYIDAWNYSDGVDVIEIQHPVFKKTTCGVWLAEQGWRPSDGEPVWKKFVLNGTGKRFAYPNRSHAWYTFTRRKTTQVRILERQLAKAYVAKRLANELDASILGTKRKVTMPNHMIPFIDENVVTTSCKLV